MAHSSTVTFGGVTVNGPVSPTDVEDYPKWVTDLSAGYTRIVYKLTAATLLTWVLQFDAITGTQKSNLTTFFHSTAEGPTNTFTYVHTDGGSYTARFLDTALRWQRVDGNTWRLTVRLELTAQVA